MKYMNFAIRTVSLLLILGVLWQYQHIAASRAAVVAERQQRIDEVEAYNAALTEQDVVGGYKDGTYEGAGMGFGGEITVSVTVADGKVAGITVLSADGEDPAYYDQALAVLDEIVSAQSTDVDTVSGATFSSTGLIDAAADALGKAAAG